MSGITVPILKFGVSYATSTQSIPSLLLLPSAGAGSATFKSHQASTTRHLNGLSLAATSTYLLAYALSPGRRHPYLLWTCLAVGIGASTDVFLSRRSSDAKKRDPSPAGKVEEEDYEDVNGSVRVNGEEVRKSMEGFKLRQAVRAGLSGFAFLLGVVGMWGDGRPVVQ
ncbi:MAG: hypothetical protein Q9162_000021 [Coniocarpon cinnabarinum]